MKCEEIWEYDISLCSIMYYLSYLVDRTTKISCLFSADVSDRSKPLLSLGLVDEMGRRSVRIESSLILHTF